MTITQAIIFGAVHVLIFIVQPFSLLHGAINILTYSMPAFW